MANIDRHKRAIRRKRIGAAVALSAIAIVFIIYVFPLVWMAMTSFKTKVQIFNPTPMFVFKPTLANYRIVFANNPISGQPTPYLPAIGWSILITGSSTLLSLILGTMTAYAVSRFRVAGKDDLMFFVLSTRMLPPIVILIPVTIFFTNLGLEDTYVGFLLLYTMFSMAFSVWMMRGFFDDVPTSFEEAAMCDGYSRIRAFFKVVLPLVRKGMAATAVFCGIMIWNEFLFAVVLGGRNVNLMPPVIFSKSYGNEGVIWGVLTASSLLFVLPVVVFTFIVRKHLLRGVTFGVVRG